MATARRIPILGLAATLAAAAIIAPLASAQLVTGTLKDREGVGIVDRKGESLPLDAELTNAMGKQVRLGDYFDGNRPVLLVPAYLECPLLCTMVIERVQDALNEMKWTAGTEFHVVTYSFDHRDTPTKARVKQESVLLGYDREVEDPDAAWAFLVGDAETVRSISTALGYHYKYLPESGQFSHNAAIYFIRPDGTIHNFIEGLDYPANQLTLALNEAANGKSATLFDRIVFACYQYDPKTGQYVIQPMTVMRIAGGVTGGAVAMVLGVLWFSGRSRKHAVANAEPRHTHGRSATDAPASNGGSRNGQPYTAAESAV